MNVFSNLRENFMCALHDFTSMLLFVTVQDVESKGNPAILSAFS